MLGGGGDFLTFKSFNQNAFFSLVFAYENMVNLQAELIFYLCFIFQKLSLYLTPTCKT